MAKTNPPKAPNPTYPIPPKGEVEITPEWIQEHAEELKAAGYTVITKDELQRKVNKEDAAAQAAKELLGIDLETTQPIQGNEFAYRELWDFLTKTKTQIELLVNSTQFSSLMTGKERVGIHFLRVFLRQIFNETPPKGQAGTIRELIGDHAKVPDGVFNDRVKPATPVRKPIRLTSAHLEQAEVIGG